MGLNAKLLTLQQNLKNPELTGENPFHKNEYVRFDTLRRELIPELNGLSILVEQDAVPTESGWAARTTLTDLDSDEQKQYLMPIAVESHDPQKIMASFSYARRYSLLSILTMVGEHDDDGNRASGVKPVARTIPDQAWDKRDTHKDKRVEQLEQKFGAEEASPFNDDPDFEEEPPPPPPPPKSSGKCITEKMQKMLYAINLKGVDRSDKAGAKEMTDHLMTFLRTQGIMVMEDILMDQFNDVLKQIPKWNPAARADVQRVIDNTGRGRR